MTREDWNDIANGRDGMTASDHADISRRLALALGYYPDGVRVPFNEWCEVYHLEHPTEECSWHEFDYRSPDVALPVLEWLRKGWQGAVGSDARTGNPYVFLWTLHNNYEPIARYRHEADTLPLAIALAAIAVRNT